jgi:putative phosphoribosyl transferase
VRFATRGEAGRRIAERIGAADGPSPSVVLGVGHGGFEVALACARRLGLPCGWIAVAHLGLPWRRDCPFGAITDDGHAYFDDEVVADHALGAREVSTVVRLAVAALRRHRPTPAPAALGLGGRPVLVVADALSTGYRALAAARAAAAAGASRVTLAAPCSAADGAARVTAASLPLVSLSIDDGPRFDPGAIYGRAIAPLGHERPRAAAARPGQLG